jgi:hypothetical protein
MFAGSFMEVLARLVRLASFAAVAFIIAGLIGFLTDEVRDTSKVNATREIQVLPGEPTQTKTVSIDITEPYPSPAVEKLREAQHTAGREFIDDVGDILMAPFAWVADGSDGWVERLLQSALALILFGIFGQILADFIRRQSDASRRAAITAREEAAAAERKRTGSYVSPA